MDGFTFNLGFNYYLGKSLLKMGVDVVGYNTNYEYYTIYHSQRLIEDHTTDLSLFVKYKYNFRNKLLIEPGFRLQYYYSLGQASPEPRLAIKYNILKNLRLKLAARRTLSPSPPTRMWSACSPALSPRRWRVPCCRPPSSGTTKR